MKMNRYVKFCSSALLTALLVLLNSSGLQSQVVGWSTPASPPPYGVFSMGTTTVGSLDAGRSICTDPSGNIYLYGTFGTGTDFDPSAGTTGLTSSGATAADLFVAKYNPAGALQWVVRGGVLNSTDNNSGNYGSIVCDGTNVYVVGQLNMNVTNTADFAPAAGGCTCNYSPGATQQQGFVAKLNASNGQWQWVNTWGTATSGSGGHGVCLDPTGNIYISGQCNGNMPMGPSPFTTTDAEAFFAKLTPAGAWTWTKRAGGTGADGLGTSGGSICYNAFLGRLAATGAYNSTAVTFGAIGIPNTAGVTDIFITELDPANGNFLSAFGFGSVNGDETSCCYDPNTHDIFLAGQMGGNISGIPGIGTLNQASAMNDIFIARYTPNTTPAAGTFTWAKSFGGPNIDRAWNISSDANGTISVCGNFLGTTTIDFGSGASTQITSTATTGGEIFVACLTVSTGTGIWALQGRDNGTTNDQARGICALQNGSGTIYSCGQIGTGGTVQMTPSSLGNAINLTSVGGSDIFFAKIFGVLPLVATQSQVNLTCNGVCTGSATVVPSGGLAPYTYSWSPSGGSGATASSLCAITYTCTITDALNTSITKTFTITQPPAIVITTISQTNVSCNGASDGAAQVSASGGTGVLTYNWTPGNPPGDGTGSVTGLNAQVFTVTVTDANTCTATRTFNITQPPALAAPTPSSNSPVCTGNTINLSTNTVAGATYSWTGPASFTSTSQNPTRTGATVAMAGTYSVTYTVGGCTSPVGTTAVTVNTTPATPSASSNSPVCTGNTINLSTPAVAGATYSWTGPNSFTSSVQNPSITNATTAMAGTYSVTVTTSGCTSGVGTTAVVVNTTPAVPAAGSNSPVCTGNTINLTTAAVAGATYSWTGPNSFASSVQNPSITNATVAMAGTYSVTVTVNGCTSAAGTIPVVVNATPATPAASSNSPVCTGNTINLSTPAVAGATYSWTGPNSFASSVQNPSITNATTAMAGTYSVTVTTSGCTSGIGTTAVVVNTTPAVPAAGSNSPVCTGNTINLTTAAVAGATYSWTGPNSFASSVQNPSITNATVAMAGTYSVTVTVNGCTSAAGTIPVVVNATPATPAASSNTPVCSGNTINLSTPAVAGATYSWTGPNSFASSSQNPSITNATVAMGGTYSVTVTTGGCTSAAGTTAVVVNATPATPTPSSNTPVCTGNTINLSTAAVAGATYSWTGPNSFTSAVQNPSITNATVAMTGTYSVTVTASGCTSGVGTTAVVVSPPPAAPTASSNTPVCTGNTINLTTPTVAGATYSWTGPNSFTSSVQNPSITNATVAMAGTYSVTVTTGGCTSAAGTTTVVVNVTPATPTASSNTPVCTGNTINLSTPAVAGATYSWTGPNSFASSVQNPSITNATVAMAGTYSVTVTANGCTSATGTTAVVVNATPATPTPSSNTPVCTGNTINLSTAAVAGATYSWTGPNSFASSVQNPSITNATVAMAGTYSVTVTASGCTSGIGTTAVVVNVTPATPTASSNTPVCSGNTINLSTPAVAGATYSWTGPNSFASSSQNPSITNATVAMGGTYSVTVTTGGCTSAAGTTAVVVNATPATPAPSSNTPVCTGNTINLSTAAVAGATYSWTGPNSFASSVQNPSITNATVAMTGTYSVTVTANGCTSGIGTTAVVVSSPPATPTASSNTPVCTGNTINLTTPTVAGATYSWTGPNSFTSSVQNPSITNATVAMAGTYSVTVTTGGCTSAAGTTTVVVNVTPATPTASSNTPVCSGNTINLSTPAVAGATYSWAGPNSFASAVQNPSITNATVAMGGTYSVTVTANGCTSAVGTTAVVVNATPATPTPSSNTPVCTGNTINLSTAAVAGATYSWTGPNSFTSSAQNPSITNATVAMAGTYSVTVTTNGCTSGVGTTAVVVNSTPATPTASSNTPVCTGNTINLSTPAVAGATYSWTGPNSFASSSQNPSITNATVAMAGTYSVTVTTNGCTSAMGTTAVVVNATPATPTASSNTPVCSGNTINLSTPTVAGATYSWTGPNSFASAVQNPSITNATVAMGGTYSVTVTTNGCTSAAGTTAVVVNATPATPTASSNTPVCTGNTINLSTPTVAGATYSWTGPNSFASSSQNPSITNATVAMAGTYSVTVTTNGCTSGVGTTAVVVNSTPATPTASSNTPVCSGNTINLSTPTVAGATYSWTGPSAFASSAQNPTRPSATVAMAGTYSVTVTVNGCTSGIGTTAVVVNATPATPTASSNTPVCTGNTINLSTPTVAGATYSWTGPSSFASSAQNPSRTNATVAMAGTYSVTVTTNGCTSGVGTTAVVVNVTPTTPTASSNTPLCTGSTINLSTPTVAGATYSWTGPNSFASSSQNPSITNATAAMSGTYSVTVTTNGCTSGVGTTTVFVNPAIVLTISETHVSCFGGSNGTATVNASGGSSGFTYAWSPSGGSAATATGLGAGPYSVLVTDAAGCTGTITTTITQPAAPVGGTTVVSNVSCFSGSNGAIDLTPTGGVGGYSYFWLPSGPTTQDRTGLAAGSYSVTITDANGCTGSVTATVTEPSAPVSGTTIVTNVSCFSGSNGAIDLTPTGGTGGYSYLWLPSGPTTQDRTGLTANTYSVQITDANGCTATVTATVTQPPIITSVMTQTNVSCTGGGNGSATIVVSGGTPGYTYTWTPVGGNAATATGLIAGCYTVIVTDANGCTHVQSTCITQPIALSVSSTVTNVSCNAANNGSVTVSVIGGTGAYTYSWSPAPGAGQGTATATGLAATAYTVTVTDANGCTITHSVAITEPAALTSVDTYTDITCFGTGDGTADVVISGGTPGYTYMWSPSGGTASTATGLGPGMYTVTATDANGCTHSSTFLIVEPSALTATATQTNVSCFGGTDGSASVSVSGGTGAYTYAWLPSGGNAATATGLGMGSYTCTIEDANGCTMTQTFSITEPTALVSTNSQTNVSCFGGSDGDATVSVSGGAGAYTYAWSPSGGTLATASNLTASAYSVVITDANGCSLTETFSITEPPALISTNTQTDVSCNGGLTGTAMVSVSGGTGAYTYAWSPSGGTTDTEINLAAGPYTVLITDANGCSITETFTITEPAALSGASVQTNVTCFGGNDGAIDITVSGGTMPYTYDWNSGTYTTEDISSLTAGTYSIVVTDGNGCTNSGTIAITEPAQLLDNGVVTNASSCTSNDGSIDLTTTGGTAPYTFVWSPSGSTEDLTGLDGGVYSVMITDDNGCSASATFTITEPGAPTVAYSEPVDTACQTTLAPFTLSGETPAGGTWTGPGVTGNTFDPMAANLGVNVIIYTYTDSAGCSASAIDSIWVDLCLDVAANTGNSIINVYPNPSSGLFTVTANEGAVITIYDALGNVAISVRAINAKTEIDLTGFTNGMYLIRIDSNGQSATERLLLNR